MDFKHKGKNMQELRKIKLYANEITYNNKTFLVYSTTLKNVRYVVKFTKACGNPFTKKGMYEVTIDLLKSSIAYLETYTNRQGDVIDKYVLWIDDIVDFKEITKDELYLTNLDNMKLAFDE